MPQTNTMPATKDPVAPTMHPVVTDVPAPIRLSRKFIVSPMIPVSPRGAIGTESNQPTGHAAANPLSAAEIQIIAQAGPVATVAPPRDQA